MRASSSKHQLAVESGGDVQLGPGRGAAAGPPGLEIGNHRLARTVAVARELQLLLEPAGRSSAEHETSALIGKRARRGSWPSASIARRRDAAG